MLLAFAGLAVAGKATAIGIFERIGFGRRFYAGQVLRDEVERRGLALTPQNEREIRTNLRDQRGMDVFARLAYPSLSEIICSGPVLLDAIYCVEERDFYRDSFDTSLQVLAIGASRETRADRLATRKERPIGTDDLACRDALELGQYRLADVTSSADHIIDNESSLSQFEEILRGLIPLLSS